MPPLSVTRLKVLPQNGSAPGAPASRAVGALTRKKPTFLLVPSRDALSQYGLYLKGADGTYYTQSSRNPSGDTSHQHFALFQESSATGAESYWIGIEDLSLSGLNGAEGSTGDYNDMLIRIASGTPQLVPEPSTVVLVLSGALLVLGLRKRRR